MTTTFWKMAKRRFIFGYPRFLGAMGVIVAIFLGSGIIVALLNGDYADLVLLPSRFAAHWFDLTPLLVGFPLVLTMMFIMMGATEE